MKKQIVIIFLFLVSFCNANAQGFVSYPDGSPVREIAYTDVEGTTLLFANFMPGEVTTTENKSYKNLQLNYNVFDNELYYLGKDKQIMIFATPVKEFKILETVGNQLITNLFRNGYPNIFDINSTSFYNVLTEGEIAFLKKEIKQITEFKPYNSSVTTKKIDNSTLYFIYFKNKIIALKKDKTFFETLFEDKKKNLNDFLANNKINFKLESDLIKLITYYNSLQ